MYSVTNLLTLAGHYELKHNARLTKVYMVYMAKTKLKIDIIYSQYILAPLILPLFLLFTLDLVPLLVHQQWCRLKLNYKVSAVCGTLHFWKPVVG